MTNRKEENVITGKERLIVPEISYGQFTLEKLRSNPLRIVQVNGQTGQYVTNKEILVKSVKLAAYLDDLDVKIGDTIAISAENHINWCVPACAATYKGVVVSPLSPQYTQGEVTHCLNISKPKVVFVSHLSETLISRVIETLSWPIKIIELDDAPLTNGVSSLKNIFDEPRVWPDPYKYKATNILQPDKQTMVILYSSGTTGLPKGVMLSHRNILVLEFALRDPDGFGMNENEIILTVIPFCHGYGFATMFHFMNIGATTIFMSSFQPETYLDNIGKYRVTSVMVAPPVMNFFAKHPMVSRYDYSSLQQVFCGAASLSPEIIRGAMERLGNPIIRQGYGMTELTVVVTLTRKDMSKLDSVGVLFPGVSCKVIDPNTSRSLPWGETGEICFKGDHSMLGYKDNPTATNETIDQDGWLHTGDLGFYDEDSYLFIVGRLKELIKYKGYQVSPSEIEAILLRHSDIEDAAVVGKPDENSGELPTAFVVLRAGSKLTADEICRLVDEQVSPQSKLRGGVHFLKAVPKSPAGKILRKELLRLLSKL